MWRHVEDVAEWDADRLRDRAEHGTPSALPALCQALAEALTEGTSQADPATVACLPFAVIADAINRTANERVETTQRVAENLADAAQQLLLAAQEVAKRSDGYGGLADGWRDEARKLMYLAINVVDAPAVAPQAVHHVLCREVVRDSAELNSLMRLGVMAEFSRPNGCRELVLSDGSLLAEVPSEESSASPYWVLESWAPAPRRRPPVVAGRLRAH